MSAHMSAIICDAHGTLSLGTRPVPRFPEQAPRALAKVRIKAFGVNRADLLQRAGHYPPPAGVSAEILGLEFSGVIEEITYYDHLTEPVDDQLSVGHRVMGICSGAAYAEYIITPLEQLLPIPQALSTVQAAALPEAYLTAFDALCTRGQLSPQDRVLIHAIGSGVGVAAAHLAHYLGAEVIGTTRSPWKKKRALQELPVRDVWIAQEGQWGQRDSRFNVIVDFIGAAYLKQNLKHLTTQGRLVVVGLLGGIRAEINLGLLLAKRAQIIGTVLRSRDVTEKIMLTQKFRREVLPAFECAELPAPIVSETFDAQRVEAAHDQLANNKTWSKLVCVWDV